MWDNNNLIPGNELILKENILLEMEEEKLKKEKDNEQNLNIFDWSEFWL